MSRFTIHHGDCLEVLKTLPDCSVDSIVTDPPYGLSDHKPAEVTACLAAWLAGKPYEPKGKGFMGKKWDAWVPGPEIWRECLRVLKPGGHVLAFAGTRSMDLMSMAIRLAGFELRDSIGYAHGDDEHDGGGAPLLAWTYGSGFPKSLDVSKAIDKSAGAERAVVGTKAGRPGYSLKQCDNPGGVAMSGNVDGSLRNPEAECAITVPATDAARQWAGWGTALKPAWEPIILARKPLGGKATVVANVLAHGTGALNIDGCRIESGGFTGSSARAFSGAGHDAHNHDGRKYGNGLGGVVSEAHPLGRWPANLIHDGSDEVLAAFPQTPGQQGELTGAEQSSKTVNTFGEFASRVASRPRGDTGSAARFFYCSKASKRDRNEGCEHVTTVRDGETQQGNVHETVKPTDLMRYICRLVTPPGGIVLDPYTGSGSTGKAAILEGFRFIGIDNDAGSVDIARARCAFAEKQVAAEQQEKGDAERQGALL